MKRSGRKDSGSSDISGFLVSPLRDVSKEVGGPIANWCKRKVTDHIFAMTKAPLGIWYPRYWSFSVVAWGIPIEKESQHQRIAKQRNQGAFLRWQEGSIYIAFWGWKDNTSITVLEVTHLYNSTTSASRYGREWRSAKSGSRSFPMTRSISSRALRYTSG